MDDPIKDGLSLERQFEVERSIKDLTSNDWDRVEKAVNRVRESDRMRGVRKVSEKELKRIEGMGLYAFTKYMQEIAQHEQKAD